MNIKELSPIKRVALGCIVIPIVFIWIIVLLMKCTGGGDEKKEVANKKEDKVRIKVNENDLIKKQFFYINKKTFNDEHYVSFVCENNNINSQSLATYKTYQIMNNIISGDEEKILVSLFNIKYDTKYNRINPGMIKITDNDILSYDYFEGFKYNEIDENTLIDHMVFADTKRGEDQEFYFDSGTFALALDKNGEPISTNYQLNISNNSRGEKTGKGFYGGKEKNWYVWKGDGNSSNKNINEDTRVEYHLSREGDELQSWYSEGISLVAGEIWKPCTKIEKEEALEIFIKVFDTWTQNRKLAVDASKKKANELENKKQF